ncbi:MAG TPA: transcriptional regulator [Morganella sp. (in: Bacteria)]|nr:transcriptional regulator [Morganella sp. (in: enterobacteria)]
MHTSDSRHDRLAFRLAMIISRLFSGETLYPAQLAREFSVSARTLQRDFSERLVFLDVEPYQGGYRLSAGQRPYRTDSDILYFADITHITPLFPSLDRKLLAVLLNPENDSPCIIYHEPPVSAPTLFGGFYVVTQAIVRRRQLSFCCDGRDHEGMAPYKLIYFQRDWYLCGEWQSALQVFRFSQLQNIAVSGRSFRQDAAVARIITQPEFITALPHYQFIRSLPT